MNLVFKPKEKVGQQDTPGLPPLAEACISPVYSGVAIKVKYFDPECKISKIDVGDWIDLRAAETKFYTGGEFFIMPLGLAIELPVGFEAHVAPRSSTFKNYGILQTNSIGIVDESHCGDNDQWFMPCYAIRKGNIFKGERICQFRIIEKMPVLNIIEVTELGNADRGGCGSTGVK